MKIFREWIILCLGGGAYVGIELLWRGRSHVTMFFLGGLCFWLIGRLDLRQTVPIPIQACQGAMLVTGLEFLTGLVVNRWLGLGVWDYSEQPLNLMGQICLFYFLMWIPLSAAGIFLEDGFRWLLFSTPFPDYRWW